MTEEELKQKPKWDEASRILKCGIEDGGCTGHSVAYVRLVEYEGQPDDEKEKLWLCQSHFSMLLKLEEPAAKPQAVLPGVPLPGGEIAGGVEYLPLVWAPLMPGLNVAATSLEAEQICGKWHLISRGLGDQYEAQTHYEDAPVADAVPVRRGGEWFWQIPPKGGQ